MNKNKFTQFDAATQIAFFQRYKKDFGTYPHNMVFNYHPYQATNSQGPEKSLQGTLRMILAGKQLAPVMFTEFGQACCASDPISCNGQNLECGNHATGDNFVYNIVNMAYQYDISWTGWAWFGPLSYDCASGLRDCYAMRNEDGSYVSNGTWGGANWAAVWKDFVDNSMPKVMDVQSDDTSVNVEPTVEEQAGYLPRPCIMGNYNLGTMCGLDLNASIDSVNYTLFASQSINSAVLPGIPPQASCREQGCPSHPCGASAMCT